MLEYVIAGVLLSGLSALQLWLVRTEEVDDPPRGRSVWRYTMGALGLLVGAFLVGVGLWG